MYDGVRIVQISITGDEDVCQPREDAGEVLVHSYERMLVKCSFTRTKFCNSFSEMRPVTNTCMCDVIAG